MKKYYTALCCLFLSITTFSQTLLPDFWEPNGPVNSVAQQGNTVYIGGSFTTVGPHVPYGAAIDIVTGVPNTAFVRPNSQLFAVIPDGSGGWFIGGNFSDVGGQPRSYLARINADGSLNPWHPILNSAVQTFAVDGNTLYVGGNFTMINGFSKPWIAAFNITTGALTSWTAPANGPIGSSVWTIAINGSKLYVGGLFTTMGGQPRVNIAKVDAVTGVATTWNPGADNMVSQIVLSSGLVYAGGSFNNIGGQPRNYLAALDNVTGLATAWNPGQPVANSSNGVISIAVNGNTVYAGGVFSTMGGQTRTNMAAVDATTGLATAWNPNVDGRVFYVLLNGNSVYVGGDFFTAGGQIRRKIVELDATTALATAWDPNANSTVFEMAISGSTVYVAGDYKLIGGQPRNCIAALDATTGQLLPWNANASNAVFSILPFGSKIYAGGAFTTIGGQLRNNLAALDATTALATSWNPNANSFVRSIVTDGTNIYIGGFFTNAGGQGRSRLAAFDVTTEALIAWNPNANNNIFSLAVSGGTVYAGGAFTTIGGQPRNRIAAIDAATGLATAWNPDANGTLTALTVDGGTLYTGGLFTTIGGQTRNRIAAFDLATGSATSWNPNANNTVNTIAVSGTSFYTGGDFTNIGGQTRNRMSTLDATASTAIWNPDANSTVNTFVINGNRLYAGGSFTSIGGQPRNNFAAFSLNLTLPVQLVSFTAKLQDPDAVNTSVVCNWNTASEENSSHFIVERKNSANNFLPVGQITATGNSSTLNNYSFTDHAPLKGISYYRLKMVDKDGRFTFSNIVAVITDKTNNSFIVYPNPVKDEATLAVTLTKKQEAAYSIFDQAGKKLLSKSVSLIEGVNIINVPVEQLPAGIYIIQLNGNMIFKQSQFVRQ